MKEAGGPAVSGHPSEFIFCSKNGTLGGNSQDMLWGGSRSSRLAPSLHGQTPQPFWSQYLPLGVWDGLCFALPTMVERGAEVTDGKDLENPEDVLCVARMTTLSPRGQGIHPDVETAQVWRLHGLHWPPSAATRKAAHKPMMTIATSLSCLPPATVPLNSLPGSVLFSEKLKCWAVGEGESQRLSGGQTKGSVRPAGRARCGKPSTWLSSAHKWGWPPRPSHVMHTQMRWQHAAEAGGPVLWFPIWSRWAFGVWRLWQTHGEQPCRPESDSQPGCTRVRVRFHTCSLEERGHGAGEEAYLHSLRMFGFF